ncbi:QueT transporter family protein [Clostridium ihumii]|uniref:QueT transporter family protein n=1 Tax=Clostridium ihumii TaxID=1470356 RepID=UPI003D32BD05
MKNKTNFLVRTSMVAALYVVVTFAFYFLSYQAIQFRISEVMVLLAFIDPLYIPGLIIGCFMSNMLGPFGIIDALFGSAASLLGLLMIVKTKKLLGDNLKSLFIASLWPSFFSFIVAFEITVVFGAQESFWFWTLMVAIGEFVVITLVGVPLLNLINKNRNLIEILKFKK